MENKYKINEWVELIKESTLDSDEKKLRIENVKYAYANNVPVILNLDHFSALTGIKTSVIRKMIYSPKSFYRRFTIKKKRGGFREIVTPHKSLLEIQQWISLNILSTFPIHDAAYGYVKSRNIAKNATLHVGCREMLKVDLKDFFPNIGIARVRELFKRVGYSKEITYFLSKLCCLDEALPQGAATSPIISNIILKTLDRKLADISNKQKLIYSRYADDLIFSGQAIPHNIELDVKNTIVLCGFKVNDEKTTFYNRTTRKMVTGIVVGNESIKLPKYKRREIKHQVFFLKKYKIQDQIRKYNDVFYVDRVLGRLSFWKQIEPNNKFVSNSIEEIKIMYQQFQE